MKSQVTRNNHYVSQWYQRGFRKRGESQLQYLDMSPEKIILPDGRVVPTKILGKRAPLGCFCEYDLYTTRFGPVINDDVEKFLFGSIDDRGAKAVRAFTSGDPSGMHHAFRDFFEYLDAQKLRTPKGLDWIKAHYASLDQVQLMIEMQGLRLMHCTMWTEGVREIVSAENSEVKFIVSDHPVTLYNASIPLDAAECVYPRDPPIEWIGTQTIFALDANTCLILTHLEYAKGNEGVNLTVPRTNARYRGSSIVRTDAFIRTRKLSRDEVVAINHLIKSRARRFLAASNKDWLFPEDSFPGEWSDVAQVLLPRDQLWRFGGEIYIGYNDGRTHYQDQFGRTSGAHEYLRRKPREHEIRLNDFCGCGSGRKFKRCCQTLSLEERPTWDFYSIRERNLMFCRAVQDILGLNDGKTWPDIQREINDDQVKRIHEAFGSLWPEDTDLPSLLPRPRNGILRAVYLGMSDPRLLSPMILAWLPYFDEIVLAHPFLNHARFKPEYSPTASPSQHKEQTLKNILLLLMLEPFIHAGLVHLIPDPGDFDPEFGTSVLKLAQERTAGWSPPSELEGWQKVIADDDHRRMLLRMPAAWLRRSMRKQMPKASDAQIDAAVAYAKSDFEADPYALLQVIEPGEAGAQLHCLKGYNLETGMYIAALTGSVIYTDMDAHWQQLHLHAVKKDLTPSAEWAPVAQAISQLKFTLELHDQSILGALYTGHFNRMRNRLRPLIDILQQQAPASQPDQITSRISRFQETIQVAWENLEPGQRVVGRIELSVPAGGLERKEVRRLLLTFGRAKSVRPIPFAMLIKFDEAVSATENEMEDKR